MEPSILGRLGDMGWTRSSLAFFHEIPEAEVVSLLPGIAEDWSKEEFMWLQREAKRQRVKLDLEDHVFLQHQKLLYKDQAYIEKQLDNTAAGESEIGLVLARARRALPRVSWKTRADRLLGHQPTPELRQEVEEKERQRWVRKLIELLEVTGLAEVKEKKPERYTYFASRFAMGRRASTIRQHVRLGKLLQVFMESVFGVRWLRHEGDLIAYIALRMEEPCGKSVPGSLFKAVAFLELAAEVPMDRRVSASLALQHFLLEAERSQAWTPRRVIKAARFTVGMVRELETAVSDITLQPYKRIFAWTKLIKLWGALRCHDMEGVPPSTLRYDPAVGLEGDIMRSKTTGTGRRIEIIQFHVGKECWLGNREWIHTGLQLFVNLARDSKHMDKDFLLPVPNDNLTGFRRRMMKYQDAMAFSRALWCELPSSIRDQEGRPMKLLQPESSSYWSEHSERITMISWAAAVGISKEVRRRWGRWKPSVDEDYVTTTRKMIHDAQKQVAQKIRGQSDLTDVVDDRAVVNNFTIWLQDVHHKTATQANREGQCIGPPNWGLPPKPFGEVVDQINLEGAQEVRSSPAAPSPDAGFYPDDSPTEVFEEEDHADLPEGEPQYPLGTYVLAIVGRGKRRTLHVSGGCHRQPGVHFKEFVIVGMERPELDPKQGEVLCSTCFSTRAKMAEILEAGPEGDVPSDSASSSTDEESEAGD